LPSNILIQPSLPGLGALWAKAGNAITKSEIAANTSFMTLFMPVILSKCKLASRTIDTTNPNRACMILSADWRRLSRCDADFRFLISRNLNFRMAAEHFAPGNRV
jgi:hypothetical protein